MVIKGTTVKEKKIKSHEERREIYLKRREYMKAYQNKWLQDRRTEWLQENGPYGVEKKSLEKKNWLNAKFFASHATS